MHTVSVVLLVLLQDKDNLQEWLLNTFSRERFCGDVIANERTKLDQIAKSRYTGHYRGLVYQATPQKVCIVDYAMFAKG